MAETAIPSGMTVQQWDNKLFTEYVAENWFRQFMGTGMNSMIHVKEDLTTKPGNTITFHLARRLTGAAKDENDVLEGAEEELDLRTHDIVIREYAHAVKWKVFDEQLTAIDLRNAHKDALKTWQGELDRDLIISALGMINGVPYASATEAQKDAWLVDNYDRVQFGAVRSNSSSLDHSTSLANIDNTADKLTPDAVSLMKRLANKPPAGRPKVRPYKIRDAIENSNAYVMFANSLAIRDLQNNATFVQANREARNRGMDNPLFSAADYVWDKVFIYEIEDIPVYTGVGAGGIDVAPVYLCGAQALAQAWAKRPTTMNEEFDYGRRKGLGIKEWMRVQKLQFGTGDTDRDDQVDVGVVTGYFAAVSDV